MGMMLVFEGDAGVWRGCWCDALEPCMPGKAQPQPHHESLTFGKRNLGSGCCPTELPDVWDQGSQHPNPLLPHHSTKELPPWAQTRPLTPPFLQDWDASGQDPALGREGAGWVPIPWPAAPPCPLRWEPALSLRYADGNLHRSIIRR